MKKRDFVRDGLSFRFVEASGRQAWQVFPKGERSLSSQLADIREATDHQTYIVSSCIGTFDARPSFEAAVALVAEHAGAWQARRGY